MALVEMETTFWFCCNTKMLPCIIKHGSYLIDVFADIVCKGIMINVINTIQFGLVRGVCSWSIPPNCTRVNMQ
jgi:hypothetical protein